MNAVGIALGKTPQTVESTMTSAQIELHFHWSQRAIARATRIDSASIYRGVYRAVAQVMGGEDPGP